MLDGKALALPANDKVMRTVYAPKRSVNHGIPQVCKVRFPRRRADNGSLHCRYTRASSYIRTAADTSATGNRSTANGDRRSSYGDNCGYG